MAMSRDIHRVGIVVRIHSEYAVYIYTYSMYMRVLKVRVGP